MLGVDFNPTAVRRWRAAGIDVMFGDSTDPDFVAHLPLAGVEWAVSAVPEHDTGVSHDDPRLALIASLRAQGFAGRIAVAARHEDTAHALEEAGIDLVLLPFRDAANQAADLLLGEAPPADVDLLEPEGQRQLAS